MSIYDHPDVAEIIAFALREDLEPRPGVRDDLTCRALVPAGARLAGTVSAKSAGVVCGIELFTRVFAALGAGGGGKDGHVETSAAAADGARVSPGDVVLRMSGDAAIMLKAERTALNLCQRMSGTATLTRRYVDAVAGTRAGIFDTRKTTPGMRVLQKHAVVAGGGRNHRMGLYDQVLIKENHIALFLACGAGGAGGAGSPGAANAASAPAEAVRRARAALGGVVIEVEIEHLRDLEPVIAAGADIVLLDNMAPELLREAVRRRDAARAALRIERAVELEASGGITLATVRAFAETGVERISTGELTHSVAALDLSMRCAPARSPAG